MLNTTIISSLQSLTPLWTQKILKHLALDSTYGMVVQMFMSSFFQGISLDEVTSYYVCYVAAALYVLYYFNFFSVFKTYFTKVTTSVQISQNESFIFHTELNTLEEVILVSHLDYFESEKPTWIYSGSYREEDKGINSMKTSDTKLKDGKYIINVNSKLKYILSIKTEGTKRTVEHEFIKGSCAIWLKELIDPYTTELLINKLNTTSFNPRYIPISNNAIVGGTILLPQISSPKYDKNVWNYYYHPLKSQLMNWSKNVSCDINLTRYAKFNQVRQMSIFCYGTDTGTGKSSVIRKIAQYTYRNVISINLLNSNRLDLEKYFRTGLKEGEKNHYVKDIIYELDEFDKTIKKLVDIKKYKEQYKQQPRKEDKPPNEEDKIKKESNEEDKSLKIESEKIDWDLDDLLSIFCGSYIPDSRIIVATGNDFEYIKEMCPQLFRAGRMTPIKFEYGNRELFCEIIKDYAEIEILVSKFKENFRFRQSAITEFLMSRDDITEEMIFLNMSSFEIIN